MFWRKCFKMLGNDPPPYAHPLLMISKVTWKPNLKFCRAEGYFGTFDEICQIYTVVTDASGCLKFIILTKSYANVRNSDIADDK